MPVAIEDRFVEHGSIPELRRMLKINGANIAERIMMIYKER